VARCPDPTVEIAWADTPLTASPTWTDVTSRLRRLELDRSADPELRRFQAGRATIELDNLDRALEPGFASGPYYPNVKRRRQVRVTVPSYALDLPGTSGNYASTPDSAALDVTGDIDIRVKVAQPGQPAVLPHADHDRRGDPADHVGHGVLDDRLVPVERSHRVRGRHGALGAGDLE
jgi:hypothetical protein